MWPMKQPLLGVVATAIVIAVSLAFLALFDFPLFVGWVAFVMLCLVPPQVVMAVIATHPPFAPHTQPGRGVVLLATNVVAALVIAWIVWLTVGEGVSPPGPIPSQYAVVVVPTTFFMAIAFGGWPFVRISRNMGMAGLMLLVVAYALTYVLFRMFFNYDFLREAPVYLASAPDGLFNGVTALVFAVTVLAAMFLLLHLDLWPLSNWPAVMKQPRLGIAWTLIALLVGSIVMWVTVQQLALDPMYVLTRITAPFIFGTIVVLNMLQGSLFASLRQPLKGVAHATVAAFAGSLLAQVYGRVDRLLVGVELPSGPPGYEYELWLVNALLSVTFPFLIVHAAYFAFWPLAGRGSVEGEKAVAGRG
jgi:hypothetical protein